MRQRVALPPGPVRLAGGRDDRRRGDHRHAVSTRSTRLPIRASRGHHARKVDHQHPRSARCSSIRSPPRSRQRHVATGRPKLNGPTAPLALSGPSPVHVPGCTTTPYPPARYPRAGERPNSWAAGSEKRRYRTARDSGPGQATLIDRQRRAAGLRRIGASHALPIAVEPGNNASVRVGPPLEASDPSSALASVGTMTY